MTTSTLSLSALNDQLEPTFIDIDTNLAINTFTNDVSFKTDIDAVVQNVKNVIVLESLWVENGNDIQTLLFESLSSPYFEFTLNDRLNRAIKSRDQRIAAVSGDIEVFPDDKMVKLNVRFALKNDPSKYYNIPIWQKTR